MNTRHHYLSLLRTFALATLTAAAVTACTDDNGDPAGNEPITPADGIPVAFTANINPGSDADPAGAPDTRTVLTPTDDNGFTVTWKGQDTYSSGTCDEICIWAAKENTLAFQQPKLYLPTTSAASSALKPMNGGEKLTLSSSGKWDFTAIYGYYARGEGKAAASISSLTQSEPGNTDHIAKDDFSVATAEQQDIIGDNSEMPAIINFKFKHMLSALQLQVKNGTGEALTVNEIRLSVTGEKITTKKYYGVIDKDWITHNDEQESDYLQLKIQTPAALASNATEPQKFHMLLFPEPAHGGKDMTITVITDRGEFTLTKPAPNGGFLAGKNYLTDITITSTPGTGETWSEYVDISTADELKTFRDNVNNGNTYQGKIVRLSNNIDLADALWTPIGNSSNKFQGTFDGRGYHISGLNVNNGTAGYAGLFGNIKDGTVRNLRVSGKVTTTGGNAGGIAGYLSGSTVENCIFDGNVSGKSTVGGIAGYSVANSRIAGCHTKGKVTGTETSSEYAGGIAGIANFATIDGCYSEAEVTTDNQSAGGIAGARQGGTITHCYATGKVSGKNSVGGIIGHQYAGTPTGCIALNPGLTRTEGNKTDFGRIVGKDQSTDNSCDAFVGMTIKDVGDTDFYATATGKHGTDLTAANCLTKTTYTDRGFTTTDGWVFDNAATWTYLPWNKAFESFSGIHPADYRIEVPQRITDALIP